MNHCTLLPTSLRASLPLRVIALQWLSLSAALCACGGDDPQTTPSTQAGSGAAGQGSTVAGSGAAGSAAAGAAAAGAAAGSAAGSSAGAAGTGNAVGDPGQIIGTFTVSLVAPTKDGASGYTSLVGKVYNGPGISQIVWEEALTGGGCTLSTPRVPFCAQPCGSSAACVEDDVCKPYPTAVSVGTVHVTGVKTSAGASEFSMQPVNKTYQAPSLPFPAFDEGASIGLRAEGADLEAFSMTTTGIKPLELTSTDLTLQRNQALELRWPAAGASANSRVHVKLDISHHGGTQGEIECDVADTGSLSLPADQITKLLDLGVAGFPTIIVTRQSEASASTKTGGVALVVESRVEQPVIIPGLTSCTEDGDCPTGQTCQSDLTCK